jgi:hypothetical protein
VCRLQLTGETWGLLGTRDLWEETHTD